MRRPHHSTVAAYLALFFALGGTAAAATGGTFTLGRSNTATTTTTLTDTSSVPLSVHGSTGRPPLAVNSKVKVANLNADRLDSLDSTALQRRVRACPPGAAIQSVATSGAVTCVGISTGSTAPTTASQGESKGWVVTDVNISADSQNDFQAVAEVTNNSSATRSGIFTITTFNGTTIVGTPQGSASSVPPGGTMTVTFFSSNTYTTYDTWTFQTDTTYNG